MPFITTHLSEDEEAGISYWEVKVRQMRPIVRRGCGIDVTRSGVWRAVMTYALGRIDEIAAAEGDRSAERTLAVGMVAPPGSRSKISKLKVLMPDALHEKLGGRGRQLADVSAIRDAAVILLSFGLRELRKEDPVEVAEFLKQHFDGEVVSGLRRGRRAA